MFLHRLAPVVAIISSAAVLAIGCGASEEDGPALGAGGSATGGVVGAAGGAMAGLGGGAASGGVASSGGGPSAVGGSPAVGGVNGTGGAEAPAGGSPGAGGAGPAVGGSSATGELGQGMQSGEGTSSEQYATVQIQRNNVPYILITNGWGPGFESHTISWLGTSFTVDAMEGGAGSNGQPASYPSVFCGKYSVKDVPACGLPESIANLKSLKTGWRWTSNGNDDGEYNAAYDIWVGNGTQLQGYLMVWLRDPKSYQPAGSKTEHVGVTVLGLPGTWDIWSGTVNNLPITNWVRAEGDQISEIEFDVMDILKDAAARGITYPGTHINSVAVGFEIWEGPIAGLKSDDFYVTAEK